MTSVSQNWVYSFAGFRLYVDEHILLRGDERVWLSPRCFSLLVKLVENAGHLLTKEALLTDIWEGQIVEEGNLNHTISNLRKALGERPNENRLIETIPRIGYRFVAAVEPVKDDGDTSESVGTRFDAKREADAGLVSGEKSGKLPPSRIVSLLRRWPILLVTGSVLVASIGISLLVTRRERATPTETDRYAPVALTHSPVQDAYPHWTKDGRIRFMRITPDHQAESWIMNVDGSDQKRVNEFPAPRYGRWSPDDQKVVFVKPNDKSALYLANVDGSNEIVLPFYEGNWDWSPDSRDIVYQKKLGVQTNLFIYSLETGEARNVTNRPNDFDADPTFSPDGRQIAFLSDRDGNSEIYIMDRDGSHIRRLTFDPATDTHPVFSPDGTQILFDSDREKEHSDVFIMNADGSGQPVNLINWPNSSQYVVPGCWSPDGTKIVFASDRNGNGDLFVTSAEGVRPQVFLSDAARDLHFPSYSPNGRFVAYESTSENKSGELRVWDSETKRESLVIRTGSAGIIPAWSPNGDSIAFQGTIDGQTEIYLVNPDGTGLKNLTQNPAKDASPTWSPSRMQIAFVSNRDDYNRFQIYVMNADGSNQQRIYYSKAMSADLSWSPDGKHIAFANDKEDDRRGNFEIFSIEPFTSDPESRLTFRPRYDVTPAYSPSGRRIAFVSNTDGNFEIYVMNADGTGLLRLTRDPAEDLTPRWSPDGTKIIFSSNRGGKFAIYELPAPQ